MVILRVLPGFSFLKIAAVLLLGSLVTAPAFAADLRDGLIGEPLPQFASALEMRLVNAAPSANPQAIEMALDAMQCAGKKARYLTVIDYSKPSTEPRFWLFDLETQKVVFEELVAHGRNTGDNYAKNFSNILGSKQSSVGLFKTGSTYYGKHGLSLRLHGLEPGINDKAYERAIVLHGASYVSEEFAEKHGRLGRSWGCPAVRKEITNKLIDLIKDDQMLFIYHPNASWLQKTSLNSCGESVEHAPGI